MMRSLRNFSAIDINGELVSLEQYQGKVVLIVNTATKCLLNGQMKDLQQLYSKYKDSNFVILGFPCNQFGQGEPEDEFTVRNNCIEKFQIDFPMFARIDVNGKHAHVLFKWLKSELGGFPTSRIKWNFTKFLIDENGVPVRRFCSVAGVQTIEKYLQSNIQLKKKADQQLA